MSVVLAGWWDPYERIRIQVKLCEVSANLGSVGQIKHYAERSMPARLSDMYLIPRNRNLEDPLIATTSMKTAMRFMKLDHHEGRKR